MTVIFISSLTLAIEDPVDDENPRNKVSAYLCSSGVENKADHGSNGPSNSLGLKVEKSEKKEKKKNFSVSVSFFINQS